MSDIEYGDVDLLDNFDKPLKVKDLIRMLNESVEENPDNADREVFNDIGDPVVGYCITRGCLSLITPMNKRDE
jgi:hypothetical protein